MVVYERAEKILARANYSCTADAWAAFGIWRKQRHCAIYLYLVLIVKQKTDTYKTVLVIVAGLLLIYLFFAPLWALVISVMVGVASLVSEWIAQKITRAWMKLAELLNKIMPPIFLSLLYFFILTPIAWLSRLSGKRDELLLKDTEATTFKTLNKTFSAKSFENMW